MAYPFLKNSKWFTFQVDAYIFSYTFKCLTQDRIIDSGSNKRINLSRLPINLLIQSAIASAATQRIDCVYSCNDSTVRQQSAIIYLLLE